MTKIFQHFNNFIVFFYYFPKVLMFVFESGRGTFCCHLRDWPWCWFPGSFKLKLNLFVEALFKKKVQLNGQPFLCSLVTLAGGFSLAVDLLEVTTVCCFFSLLTQRLILFLASKTIWLTNKWIPTTCHVLFLSWYFLFNGMKLLFWLLSEVQYITRPQPGVTAQSQMRYHL